MSETESRYTTDQAIDEAFNVVADQIVTEFIQYTGALDLPGDDIKENMKQLGYNIIFNMLDPYRHALVVLVKDKEMTHVGHIFLDGDEFKHIIRTKEEIQNGTKKS